MTLRPPTALALTSLLLAAGTSSAASSTAAVARPAPRPALADAAAPTASVPAVSRSLAMASVALMGTAERETAGPATIALPIPDADPNLMATEAGTNQTYLADTPRVPVLVADVAPEIDGRLDDAVWASAEVIDDFRQVDPGEGVPSTERTEVRLLHDADYLYIGVRCFDGDAAGILGSEMRRDGNLGSDDRIAVVIDAFFDRRNGVFFEMNSLGARGDALVEDNTRFRKDWDGIWYGQATRDAEGWSCEMRIPFKTLSFDPNATSWGFNVQRTIRRKNETVRWGGVSRDISFNSLADAGIVDGIMDIRQGAGVDVKPFGVAAYSRDHDTNNDDLNLDAGFDVFWKLRPELTLSLTTNTDFAETEVDERQVNLTRFPLFFPEKRDFFLQDAGIFEFGGIRRNPLPFFSRRIGLGSGGTPRDILVGGKLTGRLDALNLGLLNVQMQEDEELGSKNFTVARASVNVLEQSTLGALITYGDPNERGDSWLGGLDFNYRSTHLGDGKVLEGNAFIQYADDVARGSDVSWGGKIRYPNDLVNWDVGFTEIGEDFDAALGFVPRRGIREWFGSFQLRDRPEDGGWLRRIDSRINAFVITDLDNRAESVDMSWRVFALQTEAGDFFAATVQRERERLDSDFEIIDGVVIPTGDYWWTTYEFDVGTTTARPVNVGFEYRWGGFYGGDRQDWELGVDWRVSPNLTLGTDLEVNDIDLPEGAFMTRIFRGRVNVYFTPDLSWTTFAQYDNVSDSIGINSRVRWIVQPGNEVFFVVNQSLDRERVDNRTSLRVRDTQVTTKVGWTLRF